MVGVAQFFAAAMMPSPTTTTTTTKEETERTRHPAMNAARVLNGLSIWTEATDVPVSLRADGLVLRRAHGGYGSQMRARKPCANLPHLSGRSSKRYDADSELLWLAGCRVTDCGKTPRRYLEVPSSQIWCVRPCSPE